jgi:hypothetical protein
MAVVIKSPFALTIASLCPSVFLAGSIDNGAAVDWQVEATDQLADLEGIAILNPRRDDWDPTWDASMANPLFRQQWDWENDGMDAASVVFYYFAPGTKAPITLLELGLYIKTRKRIVVCCPPGYWRKGNVDLICARHGVRVYEELGRAIVAVREQLQEVQFHRLDVSMRQAAPSSPVDVVAAEEDAKIMSGLREAARNTTGTNEDQV